MIFDHEKLDVYNVALEFVAWSFEMSRALAGPHRHAREQLLRSSQSVPENIAEGNGKRSLADRRRFFEIARGSALESAASLDVLVACGALSSEDADRGKLILRRVVAMLTRMTERPPAVRESDAPYGIDRDYDYDYEHRFAEHEHEHDGARAACSASAMTRRVASSNGENGHFTHQPSGPARAQRSGARARNRSCIRAPHRLGNPRGGAPCRRNSRGW